MPYFGVHESIAGGFHQAVSRAAANGFDTVQIFSKNSNQWRGAPISDQAADAFASALEQTGLISPLIHDSYLINLASPKSDLLERSIAAFADELHRAERLGIASVVTHPGSYTTSSEQEGIETSSGRSIRSWLLPPSRSWSFWRRPPVRGPTSAAGLSISPR